MNIILMLANNFAFVLAYILIIKKFLNNKYIFIIALTFVLVIIEYLFNVHFLNYEKVALYLQAIIIALAIHLKQKDLTKSFNYSFSALCYLYIFISLISHLYFLITPPDVERLNNSIYNIFMQISVLGFGFMMNKLNFIEIINPKTKSSSKISLIYNVFFIIFLGHIISMLYPYIGIRMYYIVSLILILMNLFTQFFLIVINKKDSKLLLREQELSNIKNNAEVIAKKYTEILKLQRNTSNLIVKMEDFIQNQDNDGLLNYFAVEVMSTYIDLKRSEVKIHQMNLIGEPLVKSLLQEFLNDLTEKNEFEINIDIKPNVSLAEINKIEVYKAIKLFLNRAHKELMILNEGIVLISLYGNSNTFYFSIISSIGKKCVGLIDEEYMALKKTFQKQSNIVDFHMFTDKIFLCQKIEVKNNI